MPAVLKGWAGLEGDKGVPTAVSVIVRDFELD
jgi:hypothetical protein